MPVAHDGAPFDLHNLVTACWSCNAIKGEFTIERVGFRCHPPSAITWDGLVSGYPAFVDLVSKKTLNHGAVGDETPVTRDKEGESVMRYLEDWKRVFSRAVR